MEVYVFRCGTSLLWGVSEDRRGADLPTVDCPDWNYYGHFEINPEGTADYSLAEIVVALEQNGFWIGNTSVSRFSKLTGKM
jgi:hypothetical protein